MGDREASKGTVLLDLILAVAEEWWQLQLGKAIWKIAIMQREQSGFCMLGCEEGAVLGRNHRLHEPETLERETGVARGKERG